MISKTLGTLTLLMGLIANQANAHGLVDPMMPQLPKAAASTSAAALASVKKPFPALRLEGITIMGDFKVAMINGVRRILGDIIQGAEIIDIAPDWVMVKFQDETFKIERIVARAIVTPTTVIDEDLQ